MSGQVTDQSVVRARDIDAILFDNDGVLVDTEGLYFQATREVLEEVGVVLDEPTYVELFLRQGIGAWHLARERAGSASSVEMMRAARDRRYLELLARGDVLIAGVAEIVPALARKYRLAIVTSSHVEPFELVHARTGLLRHFELTLTRSDYVESKPAPEPYQVAVRRLGLSPERCLVIEDSERGLLAAKAAGLTCWIVPSALTAGGRFQAADAVFDSLASAASRLLL